MRLNGGLEKPRRCASNLAEILVSVDETQLVTENEQADLGMGIREPMTGTPLPASPSRFLIVTLGGRYLALDAESISGVLTLEEVENEEYPTIQGMTYRAINLACRLSSSKDRGGTGTRVVLLSEREARGSIRVSTVQGLLELQQSQILPLPMQFRGPERHWYRGMILFAGSIALVLNTTWVLNEQMSGLNGSGEPGSNPRLVAASKISASDSRVC